MPTIGRRSLIAAMLAAAAAVLLTPSAASAQAFTEVTEVPGSGWLNRPGDTTAGGAFRLVEGPATPAAGRGSLEMSIAANARSLITQQFGQTTPSVPRLFDGLTGAWSTYVPDGGTASDAVVLRFESFLDINNPAGTFTTVSVDVVRQQIAGQGPFATGTWQTWTLDDSSLVFTSAAAGPCILATPCTLAEFVAAFPNARWGTVQLGLGTAPAAHLGYVDALTLSVAGESFAWDFELPPERRSSAVVGAVTPTATGGSVPVTLTASPLAIDATIFTIDVGGVPQEVTLQPGQSQVVEIAVPFGTTAITVTSRGVPIASAEATVVAPTAPDPAPPAGGASGSPGPTLPATGHGAGELGALGAGLIAVGIGALGAAAVVVRRRASAAERS